MLGELRLFQLLGNEQMIANEIVAREILNNLYSASSQLNQTIITVQNACPVDELMEYRRAVGKVMASMYLDVMLSIYKTHPQLNPDK